MGAPTPGQGCAMVSQLSTTHITLRGLKTWCCQEHKRERSLCSTVAAAWRLCVWSSPQKTEMQTFNKRASFYNAD